MKNMDELSRALDALTACGEGLIRAAEALRSAFAEETAQEAQPQKTEVSAEEATEDLPWAETTEPARQYTFPEVRKAFASKSHAGYTAQVKALITKYGAEKLSAVKEEDYPALMADLEAIG